MGEDQVAFEIGMSVMATFAFAAPVLSLAAVLGLVIAVFQAATQIQEQTITQIVKILVISITLLVFGRALATPLIEHSIHILNDFPTMLQ
ncbi:MULTISPECIES: flagellar biosynthetic protein FliQ [Sinorhizobium]|uniref:flagellar biosynthetic protein FliQ n=1 Tax=Sinorhizobium TaxID=28105 RepID=UPI000C6B006E|nr:MULTISPECIES: flagellar biosynthetic protein FliQ [Sinorhizobium]PII38992.1 flagellar biosynthetic protein (fliQ) [Sinorhizobium meliloti CCBAU 01290]MBO1944231.1 flagellar biosynthetic protein FliQ [Sinorhizobium medicae]MDW9682885.1 flagellar biosynthesis protein FliQ [Sinorhizobium meliloti]MDW9694010.1 flagellar biosynthesis protein FliQ [Sinorhizobium meliloti]MDW9718890.1 flagellar biosynthesis protein FliQ [Sinorhizobium meliloti]